MSLFLFKDFNFSKSLFLTFLERLEDRSIKLANNNFT